eukprot:GHVP01004533.1.p1 GENE.GHVP01004533.1~~GHVP01004533.1.p1  ORF type:complete len:193 (+),score=8.89 GHVP01004533.1:581-1159(+)
MGRFEFVRMTFGLRNAPATFQRMMVQLFGDLSWDGVLTYLDDVLIHPETEDRFYQLLEECLSRLKETGLTLKLKKCDFLTRSLMSRSTCVCPIHSGDLHPGRPCPKPTDHRRTAPSVGPEETTRPKLRRGIADLWPRLRDPLAVVGVLALSWFFGQGYYANACVAVATEYNVRCLVPAGVGILLSIFRFQPK